MNEIWQSVVRLLGLGLKPEQMDFSQIALRGVIIFVVALALMRVGHKRSLARKTAFDTAFIVIVGAVLARAINGTAPLFPSIGGACVLLLLHRLFAFLACRWHGFSDLIKGQPAVLLRDGELLPGALRRNDISRGDLEEDLALCGHRDFAGIARARLERSGDISFIEK